MATSAQTAKRPAAVITSWLRVATGVAFVAAIWALAIVPTGFAIPQLVVFAGPGIVLAVAASWTAHAFDPEEWSADDAMRAAAAGAALFPPVVALLTAWGATFDTDVVIVLFVLGSWFALGAGLCAAAFRAVARRRRRQMPPARVELLD